MKKLLILMMLLSLTSTAYSKEPQLYDDDFDINKMTIKEYYGLSKMNLVVEYGGDVKKMSGYLTNHDKVEKVLDGMLYASTTFLPYNEKQLLCITTKTMPLIDYDDKIGDEPIINYVEHRIVDCFSKEYKKMWLDSFPKDKNNKK